MSMYTSCPRSRTSYAPATKNTYPASPDLALSQLMALLDPIIYGTSMQKQRPHQIFNPKFDVYETTTEYILEGEFPGLSDKSKIEIEFTDHKTLLLRGVLERSPANVPETLLKTASKEATVPVSPRLLTPTVESTQDESDTASTISADDFEIIHTPSSEKIDLMSSPPMMADEKNTTVSGSKKPIGRGKNSRVRVSERTFGPFQRTFSFSAPINIDNVTASLESGLLQIVVPRMQSFAKKIAVE